MKDSFEQSSKREFILIMGALADQRDATRAVARTVAEQQSVLDQHGQVLDQHGHLLDSQYRLIKRIAKITRLLMKSTLRMQESTLRQKELTQLQAALTKQMAEQLERSVDAIERTQSAMQSLHDEVLDAQLGHRSSQEILADHEARLSALEKKPPAA